jgi:hypothetical protein
MIQEMLLPSRCLAMDAGGYATLLKIRYLVSDVPLRSGFNCHNMSRSACLFPYNGQ